MKVHKGPGLLLSLVLAVATVGGVVSPASADELPKGEDPGEEIPPDELPKEYEPVVVEALLDCSNMAADVKAQAAHHEACEDTRVLSGEEAARIPADFVPAGGITPQNIRWGNCGSSSIYAWDRGAGRAGVVWGFQSILGPVIRRNLVVRWLNYSRNTGGHFTDSNWYGSTIYSNYRSFNTGTGSVLTWLTGNVRLAWGGTCVILVPTDDVRVT
jgi:hypothetical protein